MPPILSSPQTYYRMTDVARNRANIFSYRRTWMRQDDIRDHANNPIVPNTWTGIQRIQGSVRNVHFDTLPELLACDPESFLPRIRSYGAVDFTDALGLCVNAVRVAIGRPKISFVQIIPAAATNYWNSRDVFNGHECLHVRLDMLNTLMERLHNRQFEAFWRVIGRLAGRASHQRALMCSEMDDPVNLVARTAPAATTQTMNVPVQPPPAPPVPGSSTQTLRMHLGRVIASSNTDYEPPVCDVGLGAEYQTRLGDDGSIPVKTLLKLVAEKRTTDAVSAEIERILGAALTPEVRDSVYELLIAEELGA